MKCSKCPNEVPGTVATVMCPDCHAKEMARVHARDTTDDYTDSLLVGPYQPPPERYVRPNSSGRRVFKNEKSQQ